MSEPKKHHYVPRLLLRNFTDKNGRLHYFDKTRAQNGVADCTPEGAFWQSYLYSSVDENHNKSHSLESFYQKIETRVKPLLEKLLSAARSRRVPGLTKPEKDEWDNFVHHQWRRVPDIHKLHGAVDIDKLISAFESEFGRRISQEEAGKIGTPEEQSRIINNALVQNLETSNNKMVDVLNGRGLGIAHIPKTRKSFIIGSSPMIKLASSNTTDLRFHSVEAWLPIASDVAVSPGGARGTEQFVLITEDSSIRALNEGIFRQSTLIAAQSPQLIESLVGKIPVIARMRLKSAKRNKAV